MAYEPTIWSAGDTITSAKLNKLENAVAEGGGGIMIMEIEVDPAMFGPPGDVEPRPPVADKTFNDVMTAILDGKDVYAHCSADMEGMGSVEFYSELGYTLVQNFEDVDASIYIVSFIEGFAFNMLGALSPDDLLSGEDPIIDVSPGPSPGAVVDLGVSTPEDPADSESR